MKNNYEIDDIIVNLEKIRKNFEVLNYEISSEPIYHARTGYGGKKYHLYNEVVMKFSLKPTVNFYKSEEENFSMPGGIGI